MSKRPTGTTVTAEVVKEMVQGEVKPAKKHAGGRPRKAVKATERVTLYLTAEEKQMLQEEAEKRGVSMVTLIRMAIDEFRNSK